MPDQPCYLCGKNGYRDTNKNGDYVFSCQRCGRYEITDEAVDVIQDRKNRDKAFLISGYTLRAHLSGKRLLLMSDIVNGYLAADSPYPTVLDRMNALILHVGKNQEAANSTVSLIPDTHYPLIFARSVDEMAVIIGRLRDEGYLEDRHDYNYRLTTKGWEKFETLARSTSNKTDQCFVAMWFAQEMTPVFDHGLKVGIENAGYKAVRLDRVEHNNNIDDEIIAQIRSSGLVVADFTGQSRGVYFEAGFASGLGLPVIYTCRKDDFEKVHFDTRQYNYIVWESPEDLAKQLENRIKATAPARRT